MNNVIIGILCLILALYIFYQSPKEGKNMLGYKSPQQGIHKNIWKWSNKCFGFLAIVGSAIYLFIVVIFMYQGVVVYNTKLNYYGLIYILISVIITEIYTLLRYIFRK